MPEVSIPADIERVFDEARRRASEVRGVVIVTPERTYHPVEYPPPMPSHLIQKVEALISSDVKRKIAVIAYNDFQDPDDLEAVNAAVPFFGLLLGLGSVGHAVWIFEGHSSALAAGVRDADVIIIDSGMVPFLEGNWEAVVRRAAINKPIYLHNRPTYSLHLLG